MRPFLSLASLSMNELHLDLSKQGLPADLFGAGMVTSLGMHGVDEAYAPLTPIGRIMVDILVTRVRQRPWVNDAGELCVRPLLKLCATFDHPAWSTASRRPASARSCTTSRHCVAALNETNGSRAPSTPPAREASA